MENKVNALLFHTEVLPLFQKFPGRAPQIQCRWKVIIIMAGVKVVKNVGTVISASDTQIIFADETAAL